ncbi:MAG TPA: trehalose-phosphatase [Stellaceae bacterium]|nr:trehalose-phosphatase [Stellaceae bacterium]
MPLPLVAPMSALFLDVDGTLIEFVPRPEDARVPEELRATLEALRHRLGGALALVSGRALADVDRLFAPLKLAAAGQHGAEARLMPEGPVEVFIAPQAALQAVLAAVAPHIAANPPLRVEDKGLSIAFHYRGAEAEAAGLRRVIADAVARQGAALRLLDGHLCFDLRPQVEHKGKVVERFMAVQPFAGRMPIYVGDAGTDEDGFAAALSRGGRAIRIGAPRPTRAPEALADPAALRDWLAQSANSLAAR